MKLIERIQLAVTTGTALQLSPKEISAVEALVTWVKTDANLTCRFTKNCQREGTCSRCIGAARLANLESME